MELLWCWVKVPQQTRNPGGLPLRKLHKERNACGAPDTLLAAHPIVRVAPAVLEEDLPLRSCVGVSFMVLHERHSTVPTCTHIKHTTQQSGIRPYLPGHRNKPQQRKLQGMTQSLY